MSRVGKKPISIPDNIKASYVDGIITIQAEKASLTRAIHPSVELKIGDNTIEVLVKTDDRKSRAFQGLVRSLIENMVIGVSKGFERVLEINGIGYRAEVNGNNIVFNIGYSNPITFDIPEGVSVSVDKNTVIKLSGIDKEQLGQTAAAIRRLRPPEPYKGKGIKYAEEYIKRKAGKTGAAATV
ncbi:MAG: 50S ribosomal protein L6 [Deltaproteobacteria bacterium]|nr:50S ribosomal protein L6 [Deltaproteobacteria bacterium]MBW1812209.1 50S ribosomal protein L6 [Deltaproteobacteria bacterium]MBW1845697.1 50S ribosomal protein L6 [Deltaproteobacteria bacterium]MBW1983169.1 50S ribosomal protein L6 [Deltaproteobacteria bacterium]MBW2363597.1 50S ribosomal protein L6 [Deltaproteobacteria bacterium]